MAGEAQVAIIGAGPYGLAAAAHLRAEGVEMIAFGETMSFWEQSMPVGMRLRSAWRSSSIADPHRALTLDKYQVATGVTIPPTLPIDAFVAYAKWFRAQVLPEIDPRRVARVEPSANGFNVELEGGESVPVRRVVVAAGIAPFAYRPPQFAGLPAALVSHSSEVRDVAAFDGQSVVVIGAGQSALEGAALLHEAGAEVEVIARRPAIKWIRPPLTNGSAALKRLDPVLYPGTDVGPPGYSLIAGTPDVLRWLPGAARADIATTCTVPMGSSWLIPRLADVRLTSGRSVVSAAEANGRVVLTLDDGSQREVDHVVLATGYRVDVTKYSFLGPNLLAMLKLVGGYPRLSAGLEASVPGLHFMGAPAAGTFGPVMRFVTGTWFCGPALARGVSGKPPLPFRFAWLRN